MTKEQFTTRLRKQLSGLGEETLSDILYDYEEHFSIGLENGKTEEEICENLGSPEQIAGQYKLENAVRKAEDIPRPYNLLRVILAGIGLGFFNLIFVLGVYLGILGVMVGLFFASFAVLAAGILLIVKSLLPAALYWMNSPFNLGSFFGRAGTFFTGLGLGALGILLILFTLKLIELIYRGTLSYVKANISIIKKAGEQ